MVNVKDQLRAQPSGTFLCTCDPGFDLFKILFQTYLSVLTFSMNAGRGMTLVPMLLQNICAQGPVIFAIVMVSSLKMYCL